MKYIVKQILEPDYGAKGCRVKWNLDEDEVPSSLLPTMNTDVTLRLGDFIYKERIERW